MATDLEVNDAKIKALDALTDLLKKIGIAIEKEYSRPNGGKS